MADSWSGGWSVSSRGRDVVVAVRSRVSIYHRTMQLLDSSCGGCMFNALGVEYYEAEW